MQKVQSEIYRPQPNHGISITRDKFFFCYPYGGYNKDTLEILNSYNCAAGFTCDVGIFNPLMSNILELPRLDTNDMPKNKNASIIDWTKKIIENGYRRVLTSISREDDWYLLNK